MCCSTQTAFAPAVWQSCLTNTGASLELELGLSQGERRQGMVSTTPLGWLRAGAGLKSVKYNPTWMLEE